MVENKLCNTLAIAAVVTGLLGATPARADWEDGRAPEGDTAFTLSRHELRLSVLGRTAFGLTDRLEISTSLLFPVPEIFPNLAFKYRFHDGEVVSSSFVLGLGAGVYPVVAGGIIPLPGAVLAGGGVGAVLASFQHGSLQVSVKPSHGWTLSVSGGLFALEAQLLGVAGDAGAGEGGAGGAILPVAVGGAMTGETASVEADWVLGHHDMISFETTLVWFNSGFLGSANRGFLMPTLGWTHGWNHFHLTVGAYTLTDIPNFQMLHDSKMPVAPYVNAYWTFGGHPPTAG